MRKLKGVIELCRVHHWVKNLLILFPPFFVNRFFDADIVCVLMPALVSFSLASSVVYVINDITDCENDRQHPIKCKRPIASGVVPKPCAWTLVVLLTIVACGMTVFAHSPLASLVLIIYLGVNVLYSIKLKEKVLVDVFVLASGFVFRVFYGGFYFGIPISSWLFLCVFSSALFFAFGKRKGELRRLCGATATRPVLEKYSENFLSVHYYLCCALTIVFYCLWTINRTDQSSVGKLALTVPILFFILFRYNLLVETGKRDADPVPTFLHDGYLVVAAFLFVVVNFIVLYYGKDLPRVQY